MFITLNSASNTIMGSVIALKWNRVFPIASAFCVDMYTHYQCPSGSDLVKCVDAVFELYFQTIYILANNL